MTKPIKAIEVGVRQPDTLKLSVGGYSDAGTKKSNDDAFAAYIPEGSVKVIKGAVVCIDDGASCSDNSPLPAKPA